MFLFYKLNTSLGNHIPIEKKKKTKPKPNNSYYLVHDKINDLKHIDSFLASDYTNPVTADPCCETRKSRAQYAIHE